MLEAQDAQSASSALAPMGMPQTAEQLDAAWDKLTNVMATQGIPDEDVRKANIYKAYRAWLGNPWNPTYGNPRNATPDKLAAALSAFVTQYPVFLQLLDLYPPKKPPVGQTFNTAGEFPWWYWPLRIGAGVGAGLFIYRTLRPKRSAALSGFHSALYNDNGLTYQRWLAAARKSGEYYGYSAAQRSKLRNAWRHGEDPAEWI